jgi:MFS family permease
MTSVKKQLPSSVYLLLFAQTINLTMAVLSVTVGALAGLKLAPTVGLATVPYGLQFLGVMLFTYVASFLMRRKGRAFVFHMASIFLLVAGASGYLALQWHRFDLMCMSHFCLGLYIACANFYRFAATDGLEVAVKSRAISLVVFGGVLAAVIGPFLATHLRQPVEHYAEFALCYAVMACFAVFNSVLVFVWNKDSIKRQSTTQATEHTDPIESYAKRPIISAVMTGAFGYLVMNLLMILASLLMQGLCSFADSSQAIRWHVLSMFLPSFFTGSLIQRFGHWPVIHSGFVLLSLASIMGAVLDSTYSVVVAELVVLGLGWNFSYVGGSALLASKTPAALQHKLQGLNDTAVAVCATLGAFMPSVLFSAMGWEKTHWLAFIVCVLVLLSNVLMGQKSR